MKTPAIAHMTCNYDDERWTVSGQMADEGFVPNDPLDMLCPDPDCEAEGIIGDVEVRRSAN